MKFLAFPKNFMWGVGSSAHQVEGGNLNDWTEWEQDHAADLAAGAEKRYTSMPAWTEMKELLQNPHTYISGSATNHYELFAEDATLLGKMGVQAFRFSIEWSRIEPVQGEFDIEAIRHYQNVIRALKENGVEPWITLWHRTLPVWVAKQGGWSNKKTIEDFLRFVAYAVNNLEGVQVWMPLNEPVLHVPSGYIAGTHPPGRKNIFAAYRTFHNLIDAQNRAADLIHKIQPRAKVGICHAVLWTEPYKNRWYNKLATRIIHYFGNWKYLNATFQRADFIGLQYYTSTMVNIISSARTDTHINPQGLHDSVMEIWKRYHKPVVITENGLIDPHDEYRAGFIQSHLESLHRAIADGANVQGYFYWSFLDSFEWDTGFWPRFGLVEVDYNTFQRTPRSSFNDYAGIIKKNGIEYG